MRHQAETEEADRIRWEHIQRIYESCSRNVSETARQLNMHRRTLQRILASAPRSEYGNGGAEAIRTAMLLAMCSPNLEMP